MILGRVAGTIVATRKDEKLRGRKLLIVQVLDPETLEPDEAKGYLVCVDTVGAGAGEIVITVGGSSSRFASDLEDHPVDSAIVGIVDTVDLKPGKSEVGAASQGRGK